MAKRTPHTNVSVSLTAKDFIRVESWDSFNQAMEHNNLSLSVYDQQRRLQVRFDALKDSCEALNGLKRVRGDATSALEDAPPATVLQRQYSFKQAMARLAVQQSMHRAAWFHLYRQISEAMVHVPQYNVTLFKEMLQHNIMCAQALLDEALEVEGSACNSRMPEGAAQMDGLIQSEYAKFVEKRRKQK